MLHIGILTKRIHSGFNECGDPRLEHALQAIGMIGQIAEARRDEPLQRSMVSVSNLTIGSITWAYSQQAIYIYMMYHCVTRNKINHIK